MNLINRCGGIGMVELILSRALTRAACSNCYFPEKKVYGFADGEHIYFFDEESSQFFNAKDANEPLGDYVLFIDLKVEMFGGGA